MIERFKVAKVMIVIAAVALIVLIVLNCTVPKEWTYTVMGAQVDYSIGQRVTSAGKVYECKYWDEGSPLVVFPPAANPDWWAEVQ